MPVPTLPMDEASKTAIRTSLNERYGSLNPQQLSEKDVDSARSEILSIAQSRGRLPTPEDINEIVNGTHNNPGTTLPEDFEKRLVKSTNDQVKVLNNDVRPDPIRPPEGGANEVKLTNGLLGDQSQANQPQNREYTPEEQSDAIARMVFNRATTGLDIEPHKDKTIPQLAITTVPSFPDCGYEVHTVLLLPVKRDPNTGTNPPPQNIQVNPNAILADIVPKLEGMTATGVKHDFLGDAKVEATNLIKAYNTAKADPDFDKKMAGCTTLEQLKETFPELEKALTEFNWKYQNSHLFRQDPKITYDLQKAIDDNFTQLLQLNPPVDLEKALKSTLESTLEINKLDELITFSKPGKTKDQILLDIFHQLQKNKGKFITQPDVLKEFESLQSSINGAKTALRTNDDSKMINSQMSPEFVKRFSNLIQAYNKANNLGDDGIITQATYDQIMN